MTERQTLHPDIPEEGPRVCAGLCASVRDDPAYDWEHKPKDHGDSGLFLGGPEGEKVGWLRDVVVGNANRAPTHETREAALQRMQEAKRRKLRLFNAIFGPRKPATSGRKRKAA